MSWITYIRRILGNHSHNNSIITHYHDVPQTVKSDVGVIPDDPIQKPENDVLGRTMIAWSLVDQILSLDVSKGIVVGVLGPWGSGKTSFVNLARVYLRDLGIVILDFNPWMFSGVEHLVDLFFVELSAQLKLHRGLAEVGKDLEDYGEIFSGMGGLPLVGSWIERVKVATKILAKYLQSREESVKSRRTKVEKALFILDKPIVVVLDDIDRLTTSEICDVFKLVRLIANFPNVIYIVAFDRVLVENALSGQLFPGRDYLEKILQYFVDLPSVSSDVINTQITLAIDKALSTVDNTGPFNKDVWADVFVEIIRSLIRNMRDVRRYAISIHCTVRDLGGQVALADVLALEAIRVFLPNVFSLLHKSVAGLTTTSDPQYGSSGGSPHLKDQIDQLIKISDDHSEVVRALIQRLFLGGQRHIGGSHYGSEWKKLWLRERRVAHEDILRLYLERVAGERFQAFTDAEKAWGFLADRKAFDSYLHSLDVNRLQDIISLLEVYEDQFTSEQIVPGSIVLLNFLPDLPERHRGMFDLDTRFVVKRVVYRLLRSLRDANAVEAAVIDILPQITTLSSKLELILIIGYQEGVGHKLVSESAASKFEKSWRDEVRSATPDSLSEERGILNILLFANQEIDPSEPPIKIDDSPRMTLALLNSARSEVRSQEMGSRAVSLTDRLAWDALVELYGDEDIVRNRIRELNASQPEDSKELLQLADKYLSGWHPGDFDND